MLRVRLVAAVTVAIVALQLGGCSGSSALKTSSPPSRPLQFESVPPGAEVSTPDGQTCNTPCSLAVPVTAQTVNFALSGYTPQTASVQVHKDSIFSPAAFAPNPVAVTLQAAPKPAAKPSPRKPIPRPKVAATPPAATRPAPAAAPVSAAPAPLGATTQDNVFPTPPPIQSSVGSRFPTPSQQLPQVR